jgi:hypothetical protein
VCGTAAVPRELWGFDRGYLTTAKALGLTIPEFLLRADEVIE